jgi:lipoprotein-releasing system ATP-binding protein
MNNTVPTIKAEGLGKTYQEGRSSLSIFKNLCIQVEQGESVAIVGASGAGKTTLLNVLGGLDKPSEGKVWIQGEDVHSMSDKKKTAIRNRYLGFVYQFHHLLPEFTALENVAMPLLIAGKKKILALEVAAHWLDKVGMSKRKEHKPSTLSGGERQRVAIARALVNQPACVMMDEPTGNLDEGTAEKIQGLMFELQHSINTAFILVTHDLRLAKRMERTLNLVQGQLVHYEHK